MTKSVTTTTINDLKILTHFVTVCSPQGNISIY